ncbi:MAG: type III pantothenate kinase [Ruminococcus sp.]|nr:type III pantothenate kinase [Ruminococcus sp.]
MLLTIDVGNSNIKFGVYDGEELHRIIKLSTDSHKTADEFAVELYTLFQVYSVDCFSIDSCIICSVVPRITKRLAAAVKSVTGIDALVVGPGIKTGVNIQIDDPATLGADLVVACAAAQSMATLPCVVISMGTATAMFVIDKQKRMLGGSIAPGVSISLDALTSHGALIPSIALNAPQNVIGKNTDDSIRSGVVIGTACMIDGMISKIEDEIGEKCSVIATGGIAPMIVNSCSHEITLKDDLILEGLRIIYDKNK